MLNETFYLQPSITSLFTAEAAGKNALVATSANFEKACASKESIDIAKTVLRLDCIASTKVDEWSNMWHVHGLASVLRTAITSLYPNVNNRIRQLFHRRVQPRICDVALQNSIPLVILWTHTSKIPKQGVNTHWSPNHFVPCFSPTTLTGSTSEQGECAVQAAVPPASNSPAPAIPDTLSLSGTGQAAVPPASSSPAPAIPDTLSLSGTGQAAVPPVSSSPAPAIPDTLSLSGTGQAAVPPASSSPAPAIPDTLSLSGTGQAAVPPASSSPAPAIPDTLSLSGTGQAAVPPASSSPAPAIPDTLSLSGTGQAAVPPTSSSPAPAIPGAINTGLDRISLSPISTQQTSSLFLSENRHQTDQLKGACSNRDVPTTDLFFLTYSTPQKTVRKRSSPSLSKPITRFFSKKKQTLSETSCTPITCVHHPVSSSAKKPSCVKRQMCAKSEQAGSLPLSSVSTTTLLNVLASGNIPSKRFEQVSSPGISLRNYFKSSIESSQSAVDESRPLPKVLSDSSSEYQFFSSPKSKASDSSDSIDFDELAYFQEDDEIPPDDETSSSHTLSNDSDSDHTQVISHAGSSCSLPFPEVSCEWYEKQRALEVRNAAREELRSSKEGICDDKGNICFVDRSQVKGELSQNIQTLKDQVARLKNGATKQHLSSIIKSGEFIIANGPIVKTQELGRVYAREKGLTTRKRSVELYEMLSRYLNLAQIYMFGVAYVTQNSANLAAITSSIRSTIDVEEITKERVEDRLKKVIPSALKYLDSHRDRQVLKYLLAELTNISFAARMQDIKSRKGTRAAAKAVPTHLLHYSNIKSTSQQVRSDMTNFQQYQLTQRIISRRKLKEIRTIGEGRGRKLKSSQFPELATVLSYAFGEMDGGLQAHPRLTTGTVYRASDNVMTMRTAREVLLSLAPENFRISLSSCFNYTQNYRQGSIQSKQHHTGRNINANLSLKKPPRTGVEKLVVNLHWSSTNVNIIVDGCHNLHWCAVISKDAKAIVPTDIAPVQRPGHSWKKREIPDHSWDQSRTNSITPMTFLFLETKVESLPSTTINALDIQVSETTVLYLTRTGQSVTLLNLSFYEPDTTYKCLNEICYLLSLSALDSFFRDQTTHKLKKELIFVVDNGPAEQPSSCLVQMCLVRLL